MLIPQTPADWWSLVGPINHLAEELDNTRQQLGILTNYVDVLEKRVRALEATKNRQDSLKRARDTYKKKTHWVTQAKKDLDTLKESRKKQNLPVKTKLQAIPLYKAVTKYVKLAKNQPDKAKEVLKEIFGS